MLDHERGTSGSGMGHGLVLGRLHSDPLGDALILAVPVAMILLAVWWPR